MLSYTFIEVLIKCHHVSKKNLIFAMQYSTMPENRFIPPKYDLQEISGSIGWQSPSNIALVKYWGKHGVQLPRNPSISLTLNSSFTDTRLEYRPKESGDKDISLEFFFHQEEMQACHQFQS